MDEVEKIIRIGGPVVMVLAVFSIAALTVVFWKCWQFWMVRGMNSPQVELVLQHIEKKDHAQAQLLMGGRRNPRTRLLSRGLQLLSGAHLSPADLREELTRIARRQLNQLGSHLRILEVVAMVAPLLGLLGTVLGMISAFQAMETAGTQVNPALLSGGIWEALLTTAVGLSVAIPVSLANSWFERRIEVAAAQLSDDMGRVVAAYVGAGEGGDEVCQDQPPGGAATAVRGAESP